MSERGIVPELEIFDFGMVDYAKFLFERGVLQPPRYFNLLLGSLGRSARALFTSLSSRRHFPATQHGQRPESGGISFP